MTKDEIKAARERCEKYYPNVHWAGDVVNEMILLLDHIEAQAAEIERLREMVRVAIRHFNTLPEEYQSKALRDYDTIKGGK